MAVSDVLQICPTIENLCDSTKGRPKSSFKNDIKKVYHCPIETCKYFKENNFEKMKFLKQHFVKVHKTKSFSCDKCGKQFPLESTLNRHKLMCGVCYRCYCSAEYNAYEALITHVKRKHHVNTLKYKDMMECLKVHSTAQYVQKSFDNLIKLKAIIVENANREKLLVLKEKKPGIASSKETQTGMKMCRILPNVSSPSRTIKEQNSMKTVSMQTIIESGSRKRKKIKHPNNVDKVDCVTQGVSFNSSGTQTTPIKGEFVKQPRGAMKLPEVQSCQIRKVDSSVSTREISKSFGYETVDEFGSNHVAELPIFEDHSDSSNSSSQFNEKRIVSTDDPNLGSISSSCSVDSFAQESLETESNSFMCSNSETQNTSTIKLNIEDSFMNDSLRLESDLTVRSDSETQTVSQNDFNVLDSFLNDPLKIESNLIMCSDSETQTMFEDYFDNSYMDTYTQTCDSLFSDLDFVDIETQTPWSVFDDSKFSENE